MDARWKFDTCCNDEKDCVLRIPKQGNPLHFTQQQRARPTQVTTRHARTSQSVKRTFSKTHDTRTPSDDKVNTTGAGRVRVARQRTRARKKRGKSRDVRSGTKPRTRTRLSTGPITATLPPATLCRHNCADCINFSNACSFHNPTPGSASHCVRPRTNTPMR